jgi:LPXTG-motif cell wall-anchored protein
MRFRIILLFLGLVVLGLIIQNRQMLLKRFLGIQNIKTISINIPPSLPNVVNNIQTTVTPTSKNSSNTIVEPSPYIQVPNTTSAQTPIDAKTGLPKTGPADDWLFAAGIGLITGLILYIRHKTNKIRLYRKNIDIL